MRLSELMLEALNERATSEDIYRTQVIRNALKTYLDLSSKSVEDKLEALDKRIRRIEEKLAL
ncbi:MAG: hypothetical protein QNJ55_36850 [Xenococcus sp. MO_188.B8]|nr:hypothetical protein [Xenococcus sp. MO_188.B8]